MASDENKEKAYYDGHEIIKNLYLGNHLIAKDKNILDRIGITHIVNVTIDQPNYFEEKNSFIYKRVPVHDGAMFPIWKHFDSTCRFIDDAMNQNGKVFVHCHAGISRSATIVVWYLSMKYNLHPNESLKYVKQIRTVVRPNDGFLTQLDTEWTKRTKFDIPGTK